MLNARRENATDGDGSLTSNLMTFEVPPPGAGLTTVTDAVLVLETSEARILAFSSELLTKAVDRVPPFHFTTAPRTNPVPFTASVKALLPGFTLSGTRGSFRNGAGLVCPNNLPQHSSRRITKAAGRMALPPQKSWSVSSRDAAGNTSKDSQDILNRAIAFCQPGGLMTARVCTSLISRLIVVAFNEVPSRASRWPQ